MRIGLFAYLSLLSSIAAQAGEVAHPQGANCALAAPPEAAGEELNHGLVLRIYPRARDIGSKYTGCQIMWAPDGSKWVKVSVVAIKNGDPVRLWPPDHSQSELMACRYRNGRVVAGNPENCAAPQFLIAKSFAPGCVEKMRTAIAASGVGAPQPQGCNHE
jgi:hypothetical protein